MEHANIISFTFRNLITIVVMVTIGWFFLHLIGNLMGGTFSASYNTDVDAGGAVSLGA